MKKPVYVMGASLAICILMCMALCVTGVNAATENKSVSTVNKAAATESKSAATENKAAATGNKSVSTENKSAAKKGENMCTELLTDPILMNPQDTSISVVWFTEEEGNNNIVILYENGANNPSSRSVKAATTLMSRLRGGKTNETKDDASIHTKIYRHEAVVTGLPEYKGRSFEKISYRVKSDKAMSDIYTLHSKAGRGTPQKILLTSDLQIKPMCAANYEKVYETAGCVDAVLINGDLVDVIDRVYDWFYADNAFFKVLQGRANDTQLGTLYKGGAFLQNAPVYVALGNHDYMGKYSESASLSVQFNDPAPGDFNRITWEEMFTTAGDADGHDNYYMTTIGDLGLITLDVNRPWRLSNIGVRGRYSEEAGSTPDTDGGGEFIFEDVSCESAQYDFYEKSLASDEFKNSRYKMVMFHSPYSTFGNNAVHPFSDPVKKEVTDSLTGQKMTIYTYPLKDDKIANCLVPLMEKYGADILFEAHSHIWNRFVTKSGLNILETSNVGNSYGAFDGDASLAVTKSGVERSSKIRAEIPDAMYSDSDRNSMSSYWDINDFALTKDLYGNTPQMPTLNALPEGAPYLASNEITAFSILDTQKGCIDSYYFDTTKPDSDVVRFDSFEL